MALDDYLQVVLVSRILYYRRLQLGNPWSCLELLTGYGSGSRYKT